ncbi:hypothetical protein SPRG_11021 [Saprolegnia parasitica CBS 223.65]|uniref:Uncharacterized protein n=1 Tax=Saprolegnia parasitica (strain CBS 223.65) TaxID=695850 RepID=A0A067C7F2_SAPPC|nr:hypothetical protein SPRG_11021 [Saprolegnia parasitica CBS 223.65]KDO22707.1 hypothetical protein SPRG_11021 [Saprolegnia parasitica CBS 223.65]|eukprot:XP_012206617.1 hypothetical protein SPRG_11021 [Saprolegnia parasitica CBS 223.65]
MAYCPICRRNDGKKHGFTAGHARKAEDFVARQMQKTKELLERAKTPPFWCVFCDADQDDIAHLATKAHATAVRAFCKTHRCAFDPKLAGSPSPLPEEPAPSEPVAAGVATKPDAARRADIQAAFLDSVATRLHERSGGVAVVAPRPPSAFPNVTSPLGVVQNPSGVDAETGDRVWGGGIVKVAKKAFTPWAIDALVQQLLRLHVQPTTTTAPDAPRVTDMAHGHGLSSIRRAWASKPLHNVHSGAVPPWLVSSTEEYYRRNTRTPSASAPPASSSWLPKFGGVWEAGPRSMTKRAFSAPLSSLSTSVAVETAASTPHDAAPAARRESDHGGVSSMEAKAMALATQKQDLRAKLRAKKLATGTTG